MWKTSSTLPLKESLVGEQDVDEVRACYLVTFSIRASTTFWHECLLSLFLTTIGEADRKLVQIGGEIWLWECAWGSDSRREEYGEEGSHLPRATQARNPLDRRDRTCNMDFPVVLLQPRLYLLKVCQAPCVPNKAQCLASLAEAPMSRQRYCWFVVIAIIEGGCLTFFEFGRGSNVLNALEVQLAR